MSSLFRSRLKTALLAIVTLAIVAVLAPFAYYTWDLPSVRSAEEYRPAQVTRIVASDGLTVIGELYEEKRSVVPLETIPETLRLAFVAVEDRHFFEHQGISFTGILRAMARNLLALEIRQGASTITQQVIKNLYLSPARTARRKIRELILAWRLEHKLSKDEILWIYLNHIYFGNGCYGIYEASRYYFDSELNDLDTGEIAYLAGLPQSPENYALNRNPDKAKKRQRFVLKRMLDEGLIDEKEFEKYSRMPLSFQPDSSYRLIAPRLVQRVTRWVLDRFGEETVYHSGLRVKTHLSVQSQELGIENLQKALRASESGQLRPRLTGIVQFPRQAERWRQTVYRARMQPFLSRKVFAVPVHAESGRIGNAAPWDLPPEPMRPNIGYYAYVSNVEDDRVTVSLGEREGILEREDILVPDPLVRGQTLAVRLNGPLPESESERIPMAYEFLPNLDGAMLVLDASTGGIEAVVDGYYPRSHPPDLSLSPMEPGNTFVPLVALAALASREYTPITQLRDEPFQLDGWRPINPDLRFRDRVSLRRSLSRDLVAPIVWLGERLGRKNLESMAGKFGYPTDFTQHPGWAAGKTPCSLEDIAGLYAGFASGGFSRPATPVSRVSLSSGEILYDFEPDPTRVLDPDPVYILTRLLQGSPVDGIRQSPISTPASGRLEDNPEHSFATYLLYTPKRVCAVRVEGFNTRRNRSETAFEACRGFLESWVNLEGTEPFSTPSDVVVITMDPITGEWRSALDEDAVEEYFLYGTEPRLPEPEDIPTDGDEDREDEDEIVPSEP